MRKKIIKKIKDEKVSYLKLQFSDLQGFTKSVEVPASQIEDVLDSNIMFDGSSIDGFVRIQESDMFLSPDLASFVVIPWEGEESGCKVASFMCDVLDIDKNPFEGDPRSILKKQVAKMKEMGYESFNIGLEPEFFLFNELDRNNPEISLTDNLGYFDHSPYDNVSGCRRDIVLQLEKMGFEIEASHHEVAQSQHEINFKYESAVGCCDRVQIFKEAVKTISGKHNMYATFMPKPINGVNGSGMHSNLSLFNKEGKNIFYDKNGKSELSEEAFYFIGGILKHSKAFTVLTNPIVNSYKRLVPGYEAPCYVTYSTSNRSAMIRVPASRGQGTRVEVRSVDPTANVYLAMAALLAAGLDGIKNKIHPGEELSVNIFGMTSEERKECGIETLPKSLNEATKELAKSEFLKEVLGESTFDKYIQNKKIEYQNYRTYVHEWEIKEYLGKY